MQNFPAKTLNIIGCGKLGATLGSAWHKKGALVINSIYNRSYENSLNALPYLHLDAVSNSDNINNCNNKNNQKPNLISKKIEQIPAAEFWLLACPDDQIATVSDQLAQTEHEWKNTIVFHCSGSHPSQVLAPLIQKGAAAASVHPAFSFANPAVDVQNLRGSVCTAEGDEQALSSLKPLFEAIGFQWATISAEKKYLYHAGTVIGCNYLVTLMNASLQCLIQSGLSEALARQLLEPLASQTLTNVMKNSPKEVLTGPIQRGDTNTIRYHLQALDQFNHLKSLYQALGEQTLPLAADNLSSTDVQTLASLLKGTHEFENEMP